MIYLDHGATSFPKPPEVIRAVSQAMERCANPGRGAHMPAREASGVLFRCREVAAELFGCSPEQAVLTQSCTHGLNIAIRTLVRPGDRVVISGFEHNAVLRLLHALGARIEVAGRRLFDPEDTLRAFRRALDRGARAAVITHVSNVFGYMLPVGELAALCRSRGVPLILDAAQSAGSTDVNLKKLGADFIAMPGHKGLLGPMGTGLLLCGRLPKPLLCGGTGSDSLSRAMPEHLPDRAEAGTANVSGFAGLTRGMEQVAARTPDAIGRDETAAARRAAALLKKLGAQVFTGQWQSGTVSFLAGEDCEQTAEALDRAGIAVRAGLHCAPLAHESAGTVRSGTVRISFGYDAAQVDFAALERGLTEALGRKK